MRTDQYGQIVYNEDDLVDMVMRGVSVEQMTGMLVEQGLTLESASAYLEKVPDLIAHMMNTATVAEWDQINQRQWHMPDEYKDLDIAELVLSLCATPEELQRCGAELLMYQERNLFNLLRYLKYLVDTLQANRMIWGVGRGSSVASYVLYKLGVHRIDSMYYELDPAEFLR